jgi:hypothetical protein
MKRYLIIAAIVATPLTMNAAPASAETFVRMLSGPAGGSWYPYGAKMMELVGKQIKGVTASSGPGGGVGNAKNVDSKKAELGWTFAQTAYDAYNGRGAFKKKAQNLRFFGNLFPGVMQVAVPANSNIKSYKDFANKRLSPGKVTFGGNVAFEKLLKLHGITYDAVKKGGGNIHRVSYSDSVALMKDGHIDMFAAMSTAPTSSMIALDFSPGVRFIGLDDNIVDTFVKQNPGFIKFTLAKGTYKNQKEDVKTIAAPTILITHKDVPNEIAYQIAKVIWDNHTELVKVNKFWASVKLSDVMAGAAIPSHPGAMKYYREKGVVK